MMDHCDNIACGGESRELVLKTHDECLCEGFVWFGQANVVDVVPDGAFCPGWGFASVVLDPDADVISKGVIIPPHRTHKSHRTKV